jgi:hypothetical protein
MAVGQLSAETTAVSDRVRRTVAVLRRRGYAVSPPRLGEICLGGPLAEHDVRWAVAADPELALREGLVVERVVSDKAPAIRSRAADHAAEAASYIAMTRRFVRALVAVAPFIASVSIAGSLASGGFRASDDVDLNLVVEDGYRHLAYVVTNLLGLAHALRHRTKPVDALTRRPVAPRLMTVNLVLERSQCRPLARHDADMAFELLVAEPVFGLEAVRDIIAANPALLEHFPQLAGRPAPLLVEVPRRVSRHLYPAVLDAPARAVGRAAWRYMQWTRRHRPEALARVAYVRTTMRPYTLFDES